MTEVKFYRCNHCGNIVVVVLDGKVAPMCCGEKMELLVPGTTDAAAEKHVPAVTVDGDEMIVTVGEVVHPMLDAHYIQFIAFANEKKTVVKYLKPGDEPKALFHETSGTVYEYCNLHGLWKAEV